MSRPAWRPNPLPPSPSPPTPPFPLPARPRAALARPQAHMLVSAMRDETQLEIDAAVVRLFFLKSVRMQSMTMMRCAS
eukprot:364731-Chlamydomonas_euryale.AAC.2